MTNININRGDFIISLAGRDSGRVFIVMDVINNDYVSLTDGMLRSIKKPKKKKRKHVLQMDLPSYNGTFSNRAVSKAVKDVTAGLS